MKNVFRLAAIAVMMLLSIPSLFAQPTCDSSFSFIETDKATIDVKAFGGHTLNELYDTSVGFTWEAWVYLDDTDKDGVVFIGVGDSVLYEDHFIGLGWDGPGSKSRVTFLVSSNVTAWTKQTTSTTSLVPGRWYYIAAVCNYLTNTISLYIDGTLEGTAAIPWGPTNRLTRNIATGFGNFRSDDRYSYNGKIDEIKFWKGIRSASDILSDSAGCATLPIPDLRAYFKAKEGMGTFSASSVDTNFRAFNYAHWSTNAPVTICGTCCDTATSPLVKLVTPSVIVCDTTTDSTRLVIRVSHLTPGTPWTVTLSNGAIVSGIAGTGSYDSVVIKVHPTVTTTYTITYSSIISQPCAILMGKMTVTIIHCPGNGNPSGIDDHGATADCRVYPNPGPGQFTVSLNGSNNAQLYTVVDVNGQVVKRAEIKGDTFNFDISHMAAGVYNVIITGEHNVITRRVVVTK